MKETWKMIALLAIAIGGLLAYAFIPEQVAENIPLKARQSLLERKRLTA